MNSSQPNEPVKVEDHRVVRVEIIISTILRVGVLTSLAFIAAGIIIMFVHGGDTTGPDALQRLTQTNAEFPHSIAAVASGVAAFQGRSIIAMGLLLLVATPVVRVAVSIFAFVYERDRTFIIITSIVLGLLLLSFALGRAGG
jgi:uncharacterized membrane protein